MTFGTAGTAGFTGGGASDGPTAVLGAITLTATPWSSSNSFAPLLTVTGGGYGVQSGNGDDQRIDGDSLDEAIILTFSSAVTVSSINLTEFSGNDSYRLYIDNVLYSNGPKSGTVFRVFNNDEDSEFRLRSIEFLASNSAPDTAVPEPASILTAGLGLGLLGLARFRRK